MFQRRLSRRLSPEDHAFLALETDEAPMNIGSVAVFEDRLSYEEFTSVIESRMHLVPRYRQLVVPSPLNVGRPTWEFDPEFDVRRHIRRVVIDPPGTDSQLMALAARLYGGRLDQRKPPWEMHVVEGMTGRTAVVSKIHHCLVDGVGGVELLMVMLDVTPDPPPVPPAEPFEPPPVPRPATLLAEAIFDWFDETIDRASQIGKRLVDLQGGDDDAWLHNIARALEVAVPYFAVPATRTFFNAPLGGRRKLAGSAFPFEEVRAVRGRYGGTVNDVVLTVVGGALARYLQEHGEPVRDRELRALVPVNVRRPDQRGMLGNRISMVLVELPMSTMDPIERLRLITARTARLKRDHVGDGIEWIGELLMGMPAALVSGFAAVGPPPNTIANLVCTNIPGPMIPLYALGHRLLAHYAIAPLAWDMGIGCAVTSYNRNLYFTLQTDTAAASDVDRLNDLVRESYGELRAAAGIGEHEAPAAVPEWLPAGQPAAAEVQSVA